MVNYKHELIDFNRPILCSMESFAPIIKEHLEVVDEKKKIIITPLSDLDLISRNESLYDHDSVYKSLNTSKVVQEKLAQGIWKGEKNHPPRKCPLERFMTVEDERVSHKIRKYWHDKKNMLFGKIQFVPPLGNLVWEWITNCEMNLGFSLRIYTPNYIKMKDSNGRPYLKKVFPMFPVTWDCVEMPGYIKARSMDPVKFASQNQDYLTNNQPEPTSRSEESWIIDNPLDDITNIIASESTEAVHIIEDLYGIDIKKARAILSSDGLHVKMKVNDRTTINVPVNQYIVSSILGNRK